MKQQPDNNEIYYVGNIKAEDVSQRYERAELASNISQHRDALMMMMKMEIRQRK